MTVLAVRRVRLRFWPDAVVAVAALLVAELAIAGCSPDASSAVVSPSAAATPSADMAPSVNLDATGILLVAVGEQTQAAPPTEELKQAFSDEYQRAEAKGLIWATPGSIHRPASSSSRP